MDSVRIDKWLWAARFFKTRTLAAKACELGRVQSHNQPVKPARDLHAGDLLKISTEGGDFEVEVLLLSDVRACGSGSNALSRNGSQPRATSEARRATQSDDAL